MTATAIATAPVIGTTADLLAENLTATAAFNKESEIGETVTGEVLSWEVRQTRDYETGALETWEDGTACKQIVVNIQTDLAVNGEDDGERSLFIKWWGPSRRAFLRAVRDAGAADLEKGGILTATFAALGEQPKPKMEKPKLFEYSYTRPGAVALAEASK